MRSPVGRCVLCGARGLIETDRYLNFHWGRKRFAHECSHCGLLYNNPDDVISLPELAHGRVLTCSDDSPVGFDIFTLKMIVARQGFAIAPTDSEQVRALANAHSSLPGAGTLISLETLDPVPLTLGIMCRESDLTSVLAKTALVEGEIAECIVVVDQSPGWHSELVTPSNIRIVGRHLDRKFDAQRNYIQKLSRTDWVLQLDADEHLDATAVNCLRRLAGIEREEGVVSIGLARKNFVANILSDLYPDVQYRLNRKEIRYDGAVHERPVRPWQRSTIALGLEISHIMDENHVKRRSRWYNAISPGCGQVEEEGLLIEPFHD